MNAQEALHDLGALDVSANDRDLLQECIATLAAELTRYALLVTVAKEAPGPYFCVGVVNPQDRYRPWLEALRAVLPPDVPAHGLDVEQRAEAEREMRDERGDAWEDAT